MAAARNRTRKKLHVDAARASHARKASRANPETEPVEPSADSATQHERNKLAWEATMRFIKSGIQIDDVYETLKS
jgi:hypothetical protein